MIRRAQDGRHALTQENASSTHRLKQFGKGDLVMITSRFDDQEPTGELSWLCREEVTVLADYLPVERNQKEGRDR